MRLVAAIALADQGISRLAGGTSSKVLALAFIVIALAILLIAGLWTPVAGALVALIQGWNAYARPGDPWFYILVGTLGLALALLGPGAWSADARLFGWKRIDIRDRKS
jgi:putative oxidoreductase